MNRIKISVIISTFNRHKLLKRALKSLYCQTFTPGTFEIIVVDNNSTDKTSRMSAASDNPETPVIKYIREEKQGISPARNRGVHEAKGHIVAFLDDDAIAEPEWLESLYRVYQQFPDAAIVGGRIIPEWPEEKPTWLTRNLEKYYGALDLGDQTHTIFFPQTPFGGNFSILRQLFLNLGGFHENLGRGSSGLLSSEEVCLCYLAEQNNNSIYYTPNAVVYHNVLIERLNISFLIKRSFYQGISSIVFQETCQTTKSTSLTAHLTRLTDILKNILRNLLTGEFNLLIENFINLTNPLGSIYKLLTNKLGSK